MCAGCCRYIPDHAIKKIPLIGKWLVNKSNAETGGIVYKVAAFFLQKKIRECKWGFAEEYEDYKKSLKQ